MPNPPTPDDALLAGFERLSTALVSDILDGLGERDRVMRPGLSPVLADPLRVVAGRAYTVEVRATDEFVEIDRLLDMVDGTPTGSVVVVSSDRDIGAALWGGLVSAGTQARGARAAVVDGAIRDQHQIAGLGFPVFAASRSPRDIRTRGEVVAVGEPLLCRGVLVANGDLVVADAVGVVVVAEAQAREVLTRCLERLELETATERELLAGRGAADVYAHYGAF